MNSSLIRIKGLLLQEFYLTKHSLEIIIDTLVYPFMSVVLFGFITQFLSSNQGESASFIILGVLLWEIVLVNQYNVTVSSLWSVWSHNLSNIFIAPISTAEYLTSQILAAVMRAIGVFALLCVGAYFVFDFNVLSVGTANLLLFAVNLSVFAWWVGILLLGLIFRFGLRVQAIAWGTIFIIQPMAAVFYPVSVMPGFMQAVSQAIPATYVFEAARAALTHPGVDWRMAGIALGLNIGYSAVAAVSFRHMFRKSKASGQFARNDL